MHSRNIIYRGRDKEDASKAMIMVHGRGASANDILSLAQYLPLADFTLAAPQATNNTWYPYSFLAPLSANEPWLGSALQLLGDLVKELEVAGIDKKNIFLLGFSQGACLTLEFTARNAGRFGGVIAFTGGLIGETIDAANYHGDFMRTPVFIGTSDPDPHVPVNRVVETEKILSQMNADINVTIYPAMGHTIIEDEINRAIKILG